MRKTEIEIGGNNKIRLYFDDMDADKVMELLEVAHTFITETNKKMEEAK